MRDHPDDMAERHGRLLGELAELGMGLARDTHAMALAAETPETRERMTLAFHRLSRSVRQTLALEARLVRDRQRAASEDERREGETRRARVATRKAQVDAVVTRLIWTEAERAEASGLLIDFTQILAEEALAETFLDGPVETIIARIRDDLGLVAADVAANDLSGDRQPPDLNEDGPHHGRRSSA